MKIQFFKKENDFKKKNFGFNPNLYWEFAVIMVFMFIILSAISGYYLFMQINQEPIVSSPATNTRAGAVDKNRIDKALNYFSDREKKSAQIINSPAPVVDPSL